MWKDETNPGAVGTTDRTARRREAGVLLLVIGGGLVAGLLFDLLFGRLIPLRPEEIRDRLDDLGVWGPLAFVLLLTVAVVVSPLPSVPLDVAAGLAFGLFWGTVYVLIGAELGAIVAFLLARRFGRPWVERRLPAAFVAQLDRLSGRAGFRAILFMRVLPAFQFDWVSYAAGLTPIPLRTFAAATLIGMTPPVIAIVAVGATLPENPALSGAVFGGLVALAIAPLLAPFLPGGVRRRLPWSADAASEEEQR